MYQYILSEGVIPPFSLYLPHPRSLLVLNADSLAQYQDALVVVEMEDRSFDQTVLDKLSDKPEEVMTCVFVQPLT